MNRIYKKPFRLLLLLKSLLFYSWRFGYFGKRTSIIKPDMLTNPKAIHLGKNVEIRKSSRLEVVGQWEVKKPKIIIGDNTCIHLYFHCGAAESIVIGNNVLIAGRVYITDHDHVFDEKDNPPRWCKKLVSKPVVIEDGVWLGEGVAVLKGVTIGKRAVIGANSVVTKDVPPYCIAAGNPAKVIKIIGKVNNK
jgi:acetyltransferase-like isoleucine patch superfamily enzyme